ncbi:MAG: phosphoribosylformylglycinamidine synthase [Desulfovibrio sp.]|nr:phosphoribosylformylglycinamidine synthase [Desulfovibrio sp.]
MLYRIEIGYLPNTGDTPGKRVAARIRNFLELPVADCRIIKVFTVSGLDQNQLERLIADGVWHDPVLQRVSLGPLPCLEPLPAWLCEVGFRPGVTDNEARTARETAALALGVSPDSFAVYSASQYRLLAAEPLKREDIEKICKDLLCNVLIQRFRILSYEEWQKNAGFAPQEALPDTDASDTVEYIRLSQMSDPELERLSRANTWALSLQEMRKIRAYFESAPRAGLEPDPTDVEMEALAQTWSEHCKHKIFSARIEYRDEQDGARETIDNLYKSCIRDTTRIIRERLGARDYCLSVFTDNAGIISFINGYDACIKVETHNSPSALDPYGGALTGIVGVNRDPMGAGMGANLVCNMDVFCFAPPDYRDKLPPRLLHPARVLEGVRLGIEHGGNKSGIPTINGSIVFDPRYLGKPLVFCGTVGVIPAEICGHPGYEKAARPGDIIVMAGGRIGKDGIHGATFSSEELHEGSPATAVQIGDPITQRKLYDFIMEARDRCLYHSITDNGAGGLSSSIGEMAQDSGGCMIELEKAPLKYPGLRPWEILLSEAQERMTLAVAPDKLAEFLALAALRDVEATPLGLFNESGYFDVMFRGRPVCHIAMDFLHNGAPQLQLNAVWKAPAFRTLELEPGGSAEWQREFLLAMLSRYNICSREKIIRQYDHEVKGGSVIKPLVGIQRDGPSDGAVFRPLLESDAGLVLAHGICPKFSDFDTYWMMANAIDEAIRNAVACGADPEALAGVDNFCWPDPIESRENPDGAYKLAQLVRACQALRQFCLAYGVPCISGKDSMKNDYLGSSMRISIPPTVLFTVLGAIGNVTQAQTSDFKRPGDHIYILGGTWKELGGSEAASQLGKKGGKAPTVDAGPAKIRYGALNALMGQRSISACHDCSDGGIAVCLAEMAIGGRLGCRVNLDAIPAFEKMNRLELLYSESASRHIVTVRPDLATLLDALGLWQLCRHIGEVTEEKDMILASGDSEILRANVDEMAAAFQAGFDKILN